MTKPSPVSQSLRAWVDVSMHRSMRNWHNFAKSVGLSMSQFNILMQLHHKGACGISDISERFDITSAAASQLVDKLVQSGFVERTEDPSDRRAKTLKLTSNGVKLVSEGINERHRWMDELAKKLSAEEQGKIAEALDILTEAAQRLEEKRDIPKISNSKA